MSNYVICEECGAVEHGNLFCKTCRRVMNAQHGWELPPWPHEAERPCGVEEVQAFIDRVDTWNGTADQVLEERHELWQRLADGK